jgi:general secretion pathway protein E
MQQVVKTQQGSRLTLVEILDWMLEEKMVDAESAEKLKKERRYYRGTMHPLVIVADQKFKKGHSIWTLDALTEWLAKRVGMEYLHIDPLKIDFGAVTEVMSSAYATRFRVLPVAINTKEAVVATAEPGLREWEPEVARMIKREIRRVIANPLDIERYQVEFYNLAKSMKGARATVGGASGLSTPTTRTWCASSTGCGSTPLSSARATSTSSRAASTAWCASASTACCTRSTRSRPPCWRR